MVDKTILDIIEASPCVWDYGCRLIKGYKFCRKNMPSWKKKLTDWYHHKNLLKQSKQYRNATCKNDSLDRYLLGIRSDPYFSKKFQELPIEAVRLFFRIYNTFRKKHLGQHITLQSINPFSGSTICIPINSLRKDMSIQDLNKNMLILKDSGLIKDYVRYGEEIFQNPGDKLQSYFHYANNSTTIEVKEGIIVVVPSQSGVKCYLLANSCEESISEEDFCIVEIPSDNEIDIAEGFFTQEDLEGTS